MYTGSISVNQVRIGLPPPVRQELDEEARRLGMRLPAVARQVLIRWWEERQLWRRTEQR